MLVLLSRFNKVARRLQTNTQCIHTQHMHTYTHIHSTYIIYTHICTCHTRRIILQIYIQAYTQQHHTFNYIHEHNRSTLHTNTACINCSLVPRLMQCLLHTRPEPIMLIKLLIILFFCSQCFNSLFPSIAPLFQQMQ